MMNAVPTSHYELLTEHLQEGVCVVNSHHQISLWNHAAELITGFPSNEVLGTQCCDNILARSIPALNPDTIVNCPFEPTLCNGETHTYTLFHRHKENYRISTNLKVIPNKESSGSLGAIGIFSDASHLTEIESISQSMQKLMRIDPLTRLPNKRALFDSMKGEYLRYARYGTPFALIAISINSKENLPLIGADRNTLLAWFAQQLSVGFRKADTPGRLRGASFLVLLPHANTQAAERAAENMRVRLKRAPYPGGGQPITASFGCVSISRSDTLERLFVRAKKSLKVARGSSGSGIASL